MSKFDSDEQRKPTKIFGLIKNFKGRPVPGAKVKCSGSQTLTLFDGSYFFEVKPGLHTINVELEGFLKQQKEIFVNSNEEERLDFELEQEIGRSKIFGKVVSEETGEYLKNGLVFIVRPNQNINSKIDPTSGYFSFDKLMGGTYNIWASILNYEDKKLTVTIGDDEEQRHDFLVNKKRDEEVPWG
jgi:hypothetical protein